MINQLRADLFVLRHSGAALLSLLVCVLAAAGYTVLQHGLATGSLGPDLASGVQVFSDVLMVSLLGPLLYGTIVSGPFETKSVHNALLASSRAAFVAAKTVIAAGAVTVLSLPYGIATLIGLATGAEFLPAVPTSFSLLLAEGAELTSQRIGTVLAITATSAVLTAAKLAVCVPLAIRVQRPLVVMAAGFVWGSVADLLGGAAEDVPGLDQLVRLTPFAREHVPTPDSTGGDMLAAVAVSVVFVALMGVLAWALFRRADVK